MNKCITEEQLEYYLKLAEMQYNTLRVWIDHHSDEIYTHPYNAVVEGMKQAEIKVTGIKEIISNLED